MCMRFRGNVTNKNAWGPNTLIKQGAKLTATWEDVWEDLPSQIRLGLEDELAAGGQGESKAAGTASLFNDTPLAEHERLVFDKLRHDESTQLDDLIEQLEANLGSAEIFTALFELEPCGAGPAASRKKLCAGILKCGTPADFNSWNRTGVIRVTCGCRLI